MDDEIGQGPDKERRLPRPPRWLTAAAVAGLVAVAVGLTVTRSGGHDSTAAPATPATTAAPSTRSVPALAAATPVPQAAAPGTVLLTCDSVVWNRPTDPNWRASSLRVGTLWLLEGRGLGYARLGRTGRTGRTGHAGRTGQAAGGAPHLMSLLSILVHVDAGSTVVMRAAAGTSAYFGFLNSPASTGDYQGPDAGQGYTFVPCPAAGAGHPGMTDFYQVGFSIVPGRTASVEVWTSPSARPVWLTLTAPPALRVPGK